MKKAVLVIAIMLGSLVAFAQKVDKKEVAQLKAFLSQPAQENGTNAQALRIADLNSPATWEGVKIADGHVTEIDWKDKKLAGSLDLSNFVALTKVDVQRNKITSLNLAGDKALAELDAQRNALTSLNVEGCNALFTVNIYKNRLTDVDFQNTPFLQTMNCSNNYFTSLNFSNLPNLKTLNVQGNHLESLLVSGCTNLKNLYSGYNKLP
ncbi:MAG: hypothetical protein K2F70_02170, partial [Muribaculaceae bacterium]|nr:hypothetical protein [Muribaculaceae bacterium]